jgi:hypothetical protein
MDLNGKPLFGVIIKYNDRIDMAIKALQLLDATLKMQNEEGLQDRHIGLLAWYMLYGVSQQAREEYAKAIDRKPYYVSVISSGLSKAGFIQPCMERRNKYRLHPKIQELADYIKNDGNPEKYFVFVMQPETA